MGAARFNINNKIVFAAGPDKIFNVGFSALLFLHEAIFVAEAYSQPADLNT